jgi:hypothetical protein
VRLENTRNSTRRLSDDTRHLWTTRSDQSQVCSSKLTNGSGALWMIHQTILFGFPRLTIFNTLSRSTFRVYVLLLLLPYIFYESPKLLLSYFYPPMATSCLLHSAPLRSLLHKTDNRAGSLAALAAQRRQQPTLLFPFSQFLAVVHAAGRPAAQRLCGC